VKDAGLACAPLPATQPNDLARVLETVRRQTGLDFTGYKRPMLARRVHRRMGLSRMRHLAAYCEQLDASREEALAPASDFLISVTEFFREPEAWKVLAQDVLPHLLRGKQTGDTVRVWVPACASGEEAYSVAMVLLVEPQLTERRLKLQVFATDVDTTALDVARRGRSARTIETTVSAERRQRFFVLTDGVYQVRKELRDVVTFAPQNVLGDPPFSHMDLVSCRNLLIYLDADLQRRALQVFHFALATDGILALGKSESVGPAAALFHTVSQTARIYRRIGPAPNAMPMLRKAWGGPHAPASGAPPREAPAGFDYAQAVREALLERSPTTAVLVIREVLAVHARCALVGAALGPGMGQEVLAADLVVQRVEAIAGFSLCFRV
jgi:two-component system CheB/CheR fusion protein